MKLRHCTFPVLLSLMVCLSSCRQTERHAPSSDANHFISHNEELARQIVASGFIHSPLPLDTLHSREHLQRSKKLLTEKEIPGTYILDFQNNTGKRAVGSPDDPDYAVYGTAAVDIRLDCANLEGYNRLAFKIKTACEGARVCGLNLVFENRAKGDKGDCRIPTGAHLINLTNNSKNEYLLDIGDYRRDSVDYLQFNVTLKGHDITLGERSRYEISDIRFQLIDNQDKSHGWEPSGGLIACSADYPASGAKIAIMSAEDVQEKFSVRDIATGEIVFRNNTQLINNDLGKFVLLDFSSISKTGLYVIEAGEHSSMPVSIGQNAWNDLQWRALNFLFCQRCGYSVPSKHGKCHTDLLAVHKLPDGTTACIPYSGGWHDAGDLSQQTLQTADVVYALFEAEEKAKSYNTALAARLHEEALWGLDFVLRSRFGDGYRASSMGLLIWQDGVLGTMDDIKSVRVHNLAFDNFLTAGYEAYAAGKVPEDPALASYLEKVACEDFDFALAKFKKDGYDKFYQPYEHTYNTSKSQYHATISWAASRLYQLTGEKSYAEMAVEHIQYILDCQQTTPLADGTSGFFYRDKERKSIVHYIHQSRENMYMQALEMLCTTQENHPDKGSWMEAVKLYGGYIKSLMQYTYPYNMIPSGVYKIDEWKDTENFYALHLFPPDDAAQRYVAQLNNGIRIDSTHYVKRFPVWFNIFNGNNAVLLSTAKNAAICGRLLNDDTLTEIAREQLYFIEGKNPFAQPMVYGQGANYPQMDSFSSGEMTGEMPVGNRTWDDTDEPYWPQTNNACYKEVWTTVAGKVLSLIAEL